MDNLDVPARRSVRLSVVPIGYHAMRVLRFKALLTMFLRRWGLYFTIAVGFASVGTNAPIAVAAGLAASLLSPLRVATELGWPIVPATLAYAMAGTLPVVLTRQLWWPRAWADAERALPLSVVDVRRSDSAFCWIVMAPWQAVLLVGGIGIASNGAGTRIAVMVLIASLVAAFGASRLGLRWMEHVRRATERSHGPLGATHPSTEAWSDRRVTRRIGFATALLALPLWRGRATRSRTALVLGTTATATCAACGCFGDAAVGWSLAALALVALTATSLLRACATHELRPLWMHQPQLPLDPSRCDSALAVGVLIPTMIGIVTSAAIIGPSDFVRPGVLAGYAAILAVGCGIEATTRAVPKDPVHHAARWILVLSIAIAFGSEVLPR